MLKKYALFGGLMEEQIEKLLPFMQREDFVPDEFIITEGKANDKIFFIIEGQVTVSKQDVLLTRFCEGDTFGEIEVLDIMPAAASIKAVTNVNVLSISNSSLWEIYKEDIAAFSLLIMNLARDLSRRLRKMDERFIDSPLILK